ncbi:hypothetical protein, partial [Staphylococcus aureus]|uniref:hypothetical protein n=1 Tax=Staphylococcus aureus TaxID=1280 RepID=UPI0038B3F9D9
WMKLQDVAFSTGLEQSGPQALRWSLSAQNVVAAFASGPELGAHENAAAESKHLDMIDEAGQIRIVQLSL